MKYFTLLKANIKRQKGGFCFNLYYYGIALRSAYNMEKQQYI